MEYEELDKEMINNPKHYTAHPSGIECIEITEHLNFCLGNAIKYIWRAGLKDEDKTIQDLKKAEFYIKREIDRLTELKMKELKKKYTTHP